MNCANILLVRFDNDDESKKVTELLEKRYKGSRSVNTFQASYDGQKLPCFVKQEPESERKDGSTGIYVIHHGASGFTLGLAGEAVRKAFLEWLLSLSPESKIKKLCFVTCLGIQESSEVLDQPVPVSAVSVKEEHIYVQHICQAIAEIDTSKKLDGLMVAGYMGPVSVTSKEPVPIKTLYKDELARPIHPTWPPPLPDAKKFLEFRKSLREYVERKRVFVWKNGTWSSGNLAEYTDKDDQLWKDLLSKAETELKLLPQINLFQDKLQNILKSGDPGKKAATETGIENLKFLIKNNRIADLTDVQMQNLLDYLQTH